MVILSPNQTEAVIRSLMTTQSMYRDRIKKARDDKEPNKNEEIFIAVMSDIDYAMESILNQLEDNPRCRTRVVYMRESNVHHIEFWKNGKIEHIRRLN